MPFSSRAQLRSRMMRAISMTSSMDMFPLCWMSFSCPPRSPTDHQPPLRHLPMHRSPYRSPLGMPLASRLSSQRPPSLLDDGCVIKIRHSDSCIESKRQPWAYKT